MANTDSDTNLTAGGSEYDVDEILDLDPSSGSESEALNWDSGDDSEEEGQGGDVGGAGAEANQAANAEEDQGGEEGNDGDDEEESDDEDEDDADPKEGEPGPFRRSGAPSPELPPWASA